MSILISAFRSGCSVTTTLTASRKFCVNVLTKSEIGGRALHQYADWEKLDVYGCRPMYRSPFRDKPDDEIWWPRNTRQRMGAVAARAGWIVISPDWAAAGSEDTELGVLMELEVGHGETEVYAGVQA
jgi:hypothetical protein